MRNGCKSLRSTTVLKKFSLGQVPRGASATGATPMRCVLPILVLLALYWPGLANWFYQDDFGWLRLRQDVHTAGDLPRVLFAPKAHGNLRPLGENAYWLGLSSVFGAHALPFRLCAFLTQAASLLLLGAILERLTGSWAAALWAQILWMVSPSLAPVMSWSSIYNQVLSGFFFLLAFWFLLSGRTWAHWAAFVLGLGALEINVVYPALAASYALLYDRKRLRRIAPMFAVSALFVWVHFHFAGAQPGVYAMHFDSALPRTFAVYWKLALGSALLAAAVVVFVVWTRDRLALLGIAWFVITLAPYLPLRDHITDYYLAVPAIGLAIVGAAAVIRLPRAVAFAAIAVYLALSLPAASTAVRWHHERSLQSEELVLGVAGIRRQTPGNVILLDGIDTGLFQSAIVDAPFLALRIPFVYLAPGSEAHIQAPADLVTKFELPEGMTAGAAVYRMDRGVLRNVTSQFQGVWKPGPPRFVNIGDPIFEPYLGAGWDGAVNGYRTLRHAGSLRMGGGGALEIGVFDTRDLSLRVRVNGAGTPLALVHRDNDLSVYRANVSGAGEWMEVTLDVGTPVVFGYMEVK